MLPFRTPSNPSAVLRSGLTVWAAFECESMEVECRVTATSIVDCSRKAISYAS